jgi:hypothetical protein
MAVRKDREREGGSRTAGRRDQACEVLAVTGIRVA